MLMWIWSVQIGFILIPRYVVRSKPEAHRILLTQPYRAHSYVLIPIKRDSRNISHAK